MTNQDQDLRAPSSSAPVASVEHTANVGGGVAGSPLLEAPTPSAPSVKHTKEADDPGTVLSDHVIDLDTGEVFPSGLKEAASDNVTAVLQMAREALERLHKSADQSLREYGSARTLWATFVRDTAWSGLEGLLSLDATKSDSATGVSSPSPSAPASVEHVEQEKKKALEEKET